MAQALCMDLFYNLITLKHTATKRVAMCFFVCYNKSINLKEVFSMLVNCSLETAGGYPAK